MQESILLCLHLCNSCTFQVLNLLVYPLGPLMGFFKSHLYYNYERLKVGTTLTGSRDFWLLLARTLLASIVKTNCNLLFTLRRDYVIPPHHA